MISRRRFAFLTIVLGAVLTSGCWEETTELKGKLAMLEKRLLKQEKQVREFSGKFLPPKDFSPDIQRIADQQDRMNQILKTKVDPINNKLEEFRDWAQQAQNEQSKSAKQLQELGKIQAGLRRSIDGHAQQVRKMGKQVSNNTLRSRRADKAAKVLSGTAKQMREQSRTNDAKLLKLIRKDRTAARDAALAQCKALVAPLEKEVAGLLKSGSQANGTRVPAATTKAQAESVRQIRALYTRLRDLEEIIATQKASLLEVGSKVHKLEQKL